MPVALSTYAFIDSIYSVNFWFPLSLWEIYVKFFGNWETQNLHVWPYLTSFMQKAPWMSDTYTTGFVINEDAL